jgi:DNA-binding transcriptional LysR family regulator
MRFDLTDLRLFLTVVEHGSLTKGATALNLALASVSERVSGMEAELGAALLQRSRRGVVPTAAGTTLVRHARLVLGQVEQMRGALRPFGTGLRGRIRVQANTAVLADFLPRQLCRFLVAHPDLSVDIEERPSAEIALAVAEGRADLGLAADITDLAALQTHLLALDQLVAVVGRRHRLATQARVGFADLVGDPFVGMADAALEVDLAERAARLGRQIDTRVRLRNVAKLGLLIEAGVGVAILSQASAAELAQAAVVVLPLDEPWAARRLYLCARDFTALTPQAGALARQLIAPLRSAASGLAGSAPASGPGHPEPPAG